MYRVWIWAFLPLSNHFPPEPFESLCMHMWYDLHLQICRVVSKPRQYTFIYYFNFRSWTWIKLHLSVHSQSQTIIFFHKFSVLFVFIASQWKFQCVWPIMFDALFWLRPVWFSQVNLICPWVLYLLLSPDMHLSATWKGTNVSLTSVQNPFELMSVFASVS